MSPSRPKLATAFVVALASLAAVPVAQAQTPLTPQQLLGGLDKDMAEVILLYNTIKGTPTVDLTPQDARQQFSPQDAEKIIARGAGIAEAPIALGKVKDGLTFTNRSGDQIPIRIYYPAGGGPFPVILYFHGGGFVIATNDTYDGSARALCKDASAIVVSVEYRKAPEFPYPAALDDAIDSYKWVLNNIGTYNGISRKVAVAGESAGGNLAAEVSIAARDQGLQMPTHQLLVYPVATSNINQASDALYTSSFLPLNTAGLKYFFKFYVPDAEANDPGVAPINADLHNLPPATIIAAEEDPLRSDGVDYYNKLKAAGNPAVYSLYTGTTHEFFGMGDFVAKARAAETFGASRIVSSF